MTRWDPTDADDLDVFVDAGVSAAVDGRSDADPREIWEILAFYAVRLEAATDGHPREHGTSPTSPAATDPDGWLD